MRASAAGSTTVDDSLAEPILALATRRAGEVAARLAWLGPRVTDSSDAREGLAGSLFVARLSPLAALETQSVDAQPRDALVCVRAGLAQVRDGNAAAGSTEQPALAPRVFVARFVSLEQARAAAREGAKESGGALVEGALSPRWHPGHAEAGHARESLNARWLKAATDAARLPHFARLRTSGVRLTLPTPKRRGNTAEEAGLTAPAAALDATTGLPRCS